MKSTGVSAGEVCSILRRDQEALDDEARDADPVLYHRLESAPGSEISRLPRLRGHTELSNFPKTTSTSLGNVHKLSDIISG